MKKYWQLFLEHIHELLAYRLRVVLLIFSQFISPLVMIWIFSGILENEKVQMGPQQLISYYIFTSLLYLFLNSQIDSFVVFSIQEGGLASFLLKPISFWKICLTRDLSTRFFRLLIGLPILVILFLLNLSNLTFISIPLITLLLMVAISYLLTFLTSLLVGLLTFWVEEIWGFQNLKQVTFILLGGVVLPYQILPESLQKFLFWTPFPYLISWPLRPGFSGSLKFELFLAVAWVILIAMVVRVFWYQGLKKYNTLGVA
jgi:ABC-2 type transport system permease protein